MGSPRGCSVPTAVSPSSGACALLSLCSRGQWPRWPHNSPAPVSPAPMSPALMSPSLMSPALMSPAVVSPTQVSHGAPHPRDGTPWPRAHGCHAGTAPVPWQCHAGAVPVPCWCRAGAVPGCAGAMLGPCRAVPGCAGAAGAFLRGGAASQLWLRRRSLLLRFRQPPASGRAHPAPGRQGDTRGHPGGAPHAGRTPEPVGATGAHRDQVGSWGAQEPLSDTGVHRGHRWP